LSDQKYFATCGRGIEPILADEFRALGAADVVPGRGGVAFAGDRAVLPALRGALTHVIRGGRRRISSARPRTTAALDAQGESGKSLT
jgi:hypothetical protein